MSTPPANQAAAEQYPANRYPAVCPHVISRAPMRMEWEELTLLHWRYPAEEVQALLPDGLTVETFDGSAWIGLVPFQMRVDVPFLPTMARVLHFPETNVRTYVSGRSGEPGVYFFSLEASSLLAVLAARVSYQVPYFWADMSIDHADGQGGSADSQTIRYQSARFIRSGTRSGTRSGVRLKPGGPKSVVDVTVGPAYKPGEATELDRFLTARWALYGDLGPWITYAAMFHEPWPLHHATATHWDDELVAAAGLSQPTDEPLVHYSPKVSVRCGWPNTD